MEDTDQAELWRRWKQNGDVAARAMLIELNLVYVRRVVGKMSRQLPPHVDHDDLSSYGKIGLIRAVDHYDPDAGTPFSTYAVASIRGLILDELRVIDWAPRSLRKRAREVLQGRERLQGELGRTVSDEEVGAAIGRDATYVRQVLVDVQHSTFKSLEEGSLSDGDDRQTQDTVEGGEDPERSAMMRLTQQAVSDWLAGLEPEGQMVMALHYYYEMTFTEIARETGIPQSRVSALHNQLVLEVGEIMRQMMGAGAPT